MAEILISNRTWDKPQFKQMCGESLDEMQCSGSCGVMWPYEPTLSVKPHITKS